MSSRASARRGSSRRRVEIDERRIGVVDEAHRPPIVERAAGVAAGDRQVLHDVVRGCVPAVRPTPAGRPTRDARAATAPITGRCCSGGGRTPGSLGDVPGPMSPPTQMCTRLWSCDPFSDGEVAEPPFEPIAEAAGARPFAKVRCRRSSGSGLHRRPASTVGNAGTPMPFPKSGLLPSSRRIPPGRGTRLPLMSSMSAVHPANGPVVTSPFGPVPLPPM